MLFYKLYHNTSKYNLINETHISGVCELKFVSRIIPTKSEGIIPGD